MLFHLDEMKRRRDFYAAHPSADGKSFSFATLICVALSWMFYCFLFNLQVMYYRHRILGSKVSIIKVYCFNSQVAFIHYLTEKIFFFLLLRIAILPDLNFKM